MAAWLVGRRLRRLLASLVDVQNTTVGTWSEHALASALLAGLPAASIDAVVAAAEGPPPCPPLASRLLGATPRHVVEVRDAHAQRDAAKRRADGLQASHDPMLLALPVVHDRAAIEMRLPQAVWKKGLRREQCIAIVRAWARVAEECAVLQPERFLELW